MSSTTNKTCTFCGLPPRTDEAGNPIKMKSCSRCKSVYYHDVECQKKHWKQHKKACGKPAAVASTAAAAAATPNTANRPRPQKRRHRSMTASHRNVARRFKELRSEGLSAKEAMALAQDEFQPSSGSRPDAGTQAVWNAVVLAVAANQSEAKRIVTTPSSNDESQGEQAELPAGGTGLTVVALHATESVWEAYEQTQRSFQRRRKK
eukprot:jgi/Psemu1/5156/gm1.5156_g